MPAPKPITVLLADDHTIVREGLRSSLKRHRSIRVVGEASTGAEAIARAKTLHPDVVVMDINLPDMSGIKATSRVRAECPGVNVIALTVHDKREYVVQILQSGARGYVLKDASPAELVTAIQAAARGDAFFSPSIAKVLLHTFVGKTQRPRPSRDRPALSLRESQVLQLITQGQTTKEIASELNVGTRTVETFRARLMRKLGVRNAAELTRHALAHSLLSA